MTKISMLLAVISFLSGCISKREISFQKQAQLPATAKINIVTPSDGIYMDEDYPKSGTVVARKLVAALLPYFPNTSNVSVKNDSEFSIAPQILHWEDRATEWSGKPDKVKVSLPLYKSGNLIGSATVSAKSSWWTFGGDHPEDFLDLPFEVYASNLASKPKQVRLVKVN